MPAAAIDGRSRPARRTTKGRRRTAAGNSARARSSRATTSIRTTKSRATELCVAAATRPNGALDGAGSGVAGDGDEAVGFVDRCCKADDAGGPSSADDGAGWCSAGAARVCVLAIGCGVLVTAAGAAGGAGVGVTNAGAGCTGVDLWLGGALWLTGALRLGVGGGVFLGGGVFFGCGAGSGCGVTSVAGLVTVAGSVVVCPVVCPGGVSPAARGASAMKARTTMSAKTICE